MISMFHLIDNRLWLPLFLAILAVCSPIILGDIEHYEQFNSIIINVSYSFIAAFIFYLFIDVSKRARDIKALGPHISKYMRMLRNDADSICKEGTRLSGVDISEDWTFDQKQMESIFGQVTAETQANMVSINGNRVDFLQFLKHYDRRMNQSLEILSSFDLFLGSKWASCLADLKNEGFLKEMEMIIPLIEKKSTMGFLADSLSKYYLSLEELEKLTKKYRILD